MLDTALRAIVFEHQVKGAADIAVALSGAWQAKNAAVKRNSKTPEQAVFGKSFRRMTSVLEDSDDEQLPWAFKRR